MPPRKQAPVPDTTRLPLLPLKDVVIFPRMVVPLLVGRAASLAAVEGSLAANQPLFLCTQHDPNEEDPREDGLFPVGVAATILQSLRMPDGSMKVVVEGLGRGRIHHFHFDGDQAGAEVDVESLDGAAESSERVDALVRTVVGQFEDYAQLSQRVAPEIFMSIQSMDDPELVADSICAYLPVRVEERQELLEQVALDTRLEKIATLLMRENELIRMEHSVRDRVREQMERGHREHYLHEQLKLIHQELGNREEGFDEFTEMRNLIAKAKMPKEVKAKAEREFARYERMPMLSPESAVIRGYLEWLCEMPWSKRSRDFLKLDRAQQVLDEDHYGLEKVKDRILEYLAVRKLSGYARGPILCLVGPPGVGKTSLGESIARAMKRKFIRASLGGVRDEAEIRGHRRTYIGAMPGRVIQSIKKAGVKNPLFLLDEIDKMSTDFRGDPASALLEVLDPAQNKDFSDHYLEVSFDLSEVFFIATANNEYDIPHALHDRMEIVHLSGYTLREKEQIARLFLLPRMMAECGLSEKRVKFEDGAFTAIIQRYTREAGVRELERQIARVLRKIARRVVEKAHKGKLTVNADTVLELLGPPIYSGLRVIEEPQAGIAIGMAWTQVGGDILFIETSTAEGKGKLTLTGQLGDVMKESAEAAFTYIRAHAHELGVAPDFYKKRDLHVHVAEGAVPKDGPSAGTALLVSMLSALLGQTPEAAMAMTGEITLLGRVLPVGGIKEKVLAAHRAGVKTILLPRENEKDLPDVPREVRDAIAIHVVEDVREVLQRALPATAS